jgi:Flp pilus assembly protein TadG
VRREPRERERGQATVEFALIIPVLILVIVGLIEFGKAFNYWISLNNIASDGARWAAVGKVPGKSPATIDDLRTYIGSQFLTGELKNEVGGGGVVICFTPQTAGATSPSAGDAVTVRVTAHHTIGLVFTDALTVNLRGKATERLEQTPEDAAKWTGCVPSPGSVKITPATPVPLGTTLHATPKDWSDNPTSYTFVWQQGEVNVSDCTTAKYSDIAETSDTFTPSDGNRCYRVSVQATNDNGISPPDGAPSDTVYVEP